MAARPSAKTHRRLLKENRELRAALDEALATLDAIRSGEVDALVVSAPDGQRIFTLEGADRSYRLLFEELNEGALSLTSEGMILYANRRFAGMVNRPLEQVIGSSIQAWVSADSQGALEALLRGAVRGRRHVELTLLSGDAAMPVYLSATPMVMEGMVDCIGVVAMDLTERKRAEQALRLSEARFSDVFHKSSLGRSLQGMDGHVEVNGSLLTLLGYSEEEFCRMTWQDITHPDDIQSTQAALKLLLAGRSPSVRFEKRFLHKRGTFTWADVELSLVSDDAGRPLYILTSVRDITARKEADAALQDLKQRLQHYIENERLHLAQDLHDVPLQELYGILYRLEELRPKAQSQSAEVLAEVIDDVRNTLASLRNIASELRQPSTSHLGFERAARSYIGKFREAHPGIEVHASLQHDARSLPDDTTLLLFRALQESFSNILRHAHATQIDVRFYFDGGEACLEVDDNGKGFAVPENWSDLAGRGHYGLAGMAERLTSAGGTLKVTSAPGQPTTIRAVMPYTAAPAPSPAKKGRPRKPRG